MGASSFQGPIQQITKGKRFFWESVLPGSPKFKLRPPLWVHMRGKQMFFGTLNLEALQIGDWTGEDGRWAGTRKELLGSALSLGWSSLSSFPQFPPTDGPLWNRCGGDWSLMGMVTDRISSPQLGSCLGIENNGEGCQKLDSLENAGFVRNNLRRNG